VIYHVRVNSYHTSTEIKSIPFQSSPVICFKSAVLRSSDLLVLLFTGDVPAHLYGKTNFGDNVDDEWFIVSLLFKLSKAFPEICMR